MSKLIFVLTPLRSSIFYYINIKQFRFNQRKTIVIFFFSDMTNPIKYLNLSYII